MKFRKTNSPHLTRQEIRRKRQERIDRAMAVFQSFDDAHRAKLTQALHLLGDVYEELTIAELQECGLAHWWADDPNEVIS